MPSISDVKSVSGATSTIVIPNLAAVPGDYILVATVEYNNAVPAAPTDNFLNTYVQIGTTQQIATAGLALWLATNVVASGLVNITCRPNAAFTACVAWAINQGAYNNDWISAKNNVVTVAVGPTAAAPANSLMIAFVNIANNQNMGEQAGWNTTGANGFTSGMSTAAKVNDWNANNDCWSMYKIVTGVQTPTWPSSGGGGNWVAMAVSFGVAVPTPTSATPATGATVGGTPVTIAGTSFTSPATVTFGGVPATNVVVVSPISITCIAPAHAVGNAVITVTTAAGSGSLLASQFTYAVQPVPTSVMPQYSLFGGATPITIRGSGFINGATVTIGGTPATSVVVVDANTITCVVPAHAAGNAIITVTNP